MNDNDDYEIITSPLSGRFTHDGTTVEVLIYRGAEENQWVLEVVDEEDASTVWDDQFPTDIAAFEAFKETVEKEGIRSFLEERPQRLN